MISQRRRFHSRFRMLAILFCLTGLMASEAQATPTRHTWVQATPLGVSETSYFYLLMERRNPGSYYDYTETLLLVRRDISNGRLQERIQLRETRFSADADDVWSQTERPTAGVDLGKYLSQHSVQTVIPIKLSADWKIEKNQLVSVAKGKSKVLVGKEVMAQPLAELVPEFGEPKGDHEFQIGAAFESHSLKGLKTPPRTLVIIESGSAEYESNFCQHVVFVPDSALPHKSSSDRLSESRRATTKNYLAFSHPMRMLNPQRNESVLWRFCGAATQANDHNRRFEVIDSCK